MSSPSAPAPPARCLVYISGPPGVGKSSLMAALTAGLIREPVTGPVPHDVLRPQPYAPPLAAELGARRARFPGTDALSMSIQPRICPWLHGQPYPLLLAEGDRLATAGFITAALDALDQVFVIALEAPTGVLDARCVARGSRQNLTWRRGRGTKAARFADLSDQAGAAVFRFNATRPIDEMVAEARRIIPSIGQLASLEPLTP